MIFIAAIYLLSLVPSIIMTPRIYQNHPLNWNLVLVFLSVWLVMPVFIILKLMKLI